ncbi:MAG: DUF2461 domain-containing protein [Acidimicrobiia bacterium]
MAFRGWPAEALEFLEGLEADNSRSYWQANKSTYELTVKAPMDALLAELEPEFGKAKVFRPYRDLRFSTDKTPYKTNVGASLASGGYVELSANGLAAGCGYWHMAADQLARFRASVADDRTGKALADMLAELSAMGIEAISRSELKTAPNGYLKDHPRIALLRRKGLATWQLWPVAPWLGTAKAKDRLVPFLRASSPVHDWLDRHVGPSTPSET